jgi:hypothetical protein
MHTLLVIVAGLATLGLSLATSWMLSGHSNAVLAVSALWFIPVWLSAAAVNLWIGVSQAGYSVADEFPIFLIVFAVPAVVALVVWWYFSRG